MLFSYQLTLLNFVQPFAFEPQKLLYYIIASFVCQELFSFLFNQDFQAKNSFFQPKLLKLCVNSFCIISHFRRLSRTFLNYFLRNSFIFLSKLFSSCATESIIPQLPYTVKHFFYFFDINFCRYHFRLFYPVSFYYSFFPDPFFRNSSSIISS